MAAAYNLDMLNPTVRIDTGTDGATKWRQAVVICDASPGGRHSPGAALFYHLTRYTLDYAPGQRFEREEHDALGAAWSAYICQAERDAGHRGRPEWHVTVAGSPIAMADLRARLKVMGHAALDAHDARS